MPDALNHAPILYISDISINRFDSADLFDLAFLLNSPEKFLLQGIVLEKEETEGPRVVDALAVRSTGTGNIAYRFGANGFADALRDAQEPLNIVAVANFAALATVLREDRKLFREKVARLFLIGGHANDYTVPRAQGERLPIDPRLQERHPERFATAGDLRLDTPVERQAFTELLISGEGVIWLPRDVCLWRYAAPQILTDGGGVCEWLLRELFWANLQTTKDRFAAGDAPVLLSTLPALLLATQPDPLGWLRMFRAVTAHVEADTEAGRVTSIAMKHEHPNLYAVVGIDGRALGDQITKTLRVRPLVTV